MTAVNLLDHVLDYRAGGWELFPLGARSKVPAIRSCHPDGDPLRGICKGECGFEGHGCLDATADLDTIRRWWPAGSRRNIGGRVPVGLFVLDIDPRHGGDVNLRQLIAEHGGQWCRSLTVSTGGGGWHIYFEHPGGTINQGRLPEGVEIKTHAGYVVLPPSVHPDGPTYRWVEPWHPIGPAVGWLVDLLRPVVRVSAPQPALSRPMAPAGTWGRSGGSDESPADWFTAANRWADILVGWHVVAGNGEDDGSRWRHPTATSPWSATIRHDLLFNYSPNAGLPVTVPGDAQGLTRFRAWAWLDHRGDLSGAARAARELRAKGWAA